MSKRIMDEERKMKSRIISMTDPKEKANVRLENLKDILDKVARVIGDVHKPAGVRRLQSGDLKIRRFEISDDLSSTVDKKKAEAATNWTKVINGDAPYLRSDGSSTPTTRGSHG